MAKLSNIANVVIDLRTRSVGKASFGIPAVMSVLGDQFTQKAYTFDDVNSAIAFTGDVGSTKLPATVIAAIQAAFSQSPRPASVVVGNMAAGQGKIEVQLNVPATSAIGQKYGIVGTNGMAAVYTTIAANESKSTVTNGLRTAMQNNVPLSAAFAISADTVSAKITLTPQRSSAATANITVDPGAASNNPTGTTVVSIPGKPDYTVELTAIQDADQSWYGFGIPEIAAVDLDTVAKWAESAEPPVQFWTADTEPQVWTVPDGPSAQDPLSKLKRAQYDRTLYIPTKNPDELEHFAAMGSFFVGEPGSIIAGLKTLRGIQPSKFTPGETKVILAKNGNTYEQYASNVFLFNPGKMVSGAWADEIRDRDWLQNYIQTSLVGVMIRAPKLPYTNDGITTIVNNLSGCLRYAQKKGVIAPDQVDALGRTVPGFVITAPNALDVPFDLKAARTLEISFTALLAGAIQKLEIKGVLTYTYEEAA